MSNVTVPYGDNAEETAVLLLDAAISLDLPAGVVTTGSFGNFYAPEEVADAAGVDYIASDTPDEPANANVEPVLSSDEPDRYLVAGETDLEGKDAILGVTSGHDTSTRGINDGGAIEPIDATPAETEGDFDPADHDVKEVLAYLAENPDQREAVIAAEQQGKNRVTITESQE